MKGIVGIFIVGIIAAIASVGVMRSSASEDSHQIAMGFDDESGGMVEMNSVVGMLVIKREPPRSDPISGTVYWNEWVDEHFQIRDSSGQPVELKRIAHTSLIPDKKAGAGAEFFLSAKLKAGGEYQYDYIPIKSEDKTYRCTFTAPNKKETRRLTFSLVK